MRHPLSQRFHELCDEAKEMHDQKQQDYGSDNDPFANLRGSEALGIPAWVGAVLRNNDKQARLNLASKQMVETGSPSLANEGVLDSLMDQAVYALIGYVLYEEWLNEEATSQQEEPDDFSFDLFGEEFPHFPNLTEHPWLTWEDKEEQLPLFSTDRYEHTDADGTVTPFTVTFIS